MKTSILLIVILSLNASPSYSQGEPPIQQKIQQFQSSESRPKEGYRRLLAENETIRESDPVQYFVNASSLFWGWVQHRDTGQKWPVHWEEWLPAAKAILEAGHAEAERAYQTKPHGITHTPLFLKFETARTMLRYSLLCKSSPGLEMAEPVAQLISRLYSEVPRNYSQKIPYLRDGPTAEDLKHTDGITRWKKRIAEQEAPILERWRYHGRVKDTAKDIQSELERYLEISLSMNSLTPAQVKQIKAIYQDKSPAPLMKD